MASSPDWGKPKPRLLKKRNFHTEAATPHPKQWDRKKGTVEERGSLASRPTGPKLEPPTFPVLQDSQTPSLPRKTGEKKEKKAHTIHSYALMGNQEKVICVNRSNREQQNLPAYPQDMLKFGISQVSEDSPEEGKMHLQERVQGSAAEVPAARKRYYLHNGWSLNPTCGDNHTLQSQAKAGQRTSQVRSSFDGSMFLGCKLIGHGRDLFPDFGNRLRLWYKNNI